MKSLDAAVAPIAHYKPAPRGPSAARAMNRVAPSRPRYASSVAEAKAAAEAAAAATAARRAKAAAAAATAGLTTSDTEPITSSGDTAVAAASPAGPTVSSTEPITSSADASGRHASPSPPPPSEAAPAADPGEALGGAGGMAVSSTLGEADPGPVAASHTVPTAQEGAPAGTGESGTARNDAKLGVDPFVRSQKIARTPTRPAVGAVARGVVHATDVTETAVAHETADAKVTANHGVIAGGIQDGDSDAVPGTESRSEEATAEVGVEGEGSPEAPGLDPFASRSNIPRTPTDEVAPPRESLVQEGVVGVERGDAGPMGEGEARLRIGELHQELACMTDRLTKQAEERNR